ncbi:MAG TPA: outer membrane protein assembly factor BamE [Burkholderiaceae bacterium]|nr:outer membrane protein assembly factor BamE [Burkholderiaceae bacterium]
MLTTAKPIFSTLRAGLAASAIALALAACGTTNWGFPYRPDVQQGNWITAEQVAQLQKGMSREQVRFILGTPTLQDVFRTNRWDYPYYNKPGYGDEQERKFTVWFEGDSLVRWEGDQQPDRQPFQKADTGTGEAGDAQDGTGKISSDDAPEQTSAQTSPVVDGSGQGSNAPNDGKTATDADAQDAQPQGAAAAQPRRPLINASEPRTANPGAPNPGRSTAEPLR